jgi:hypothetical protein
MTTTQFLVQTGRTLRGRGSNRCPPCSGVHAENFTAPEGIRIRFRLNDGSKDGYCNALISRAWCSLAELEGFLARQEQHSHRAKLTRRLKSACRRTLTNPDNG